MAEGQSLLFVDAYDSFSENIKALLNQTLSAEITTIRIDTCIEDELNISLAEFVNRFSAIVLGPGPGDPRNGTNDTGIFDDILRHASVFQVPVLGICLGFQTLCLRYGLSVQRLPEPCHGHAKQIIPLSAHPIYQGIDSEPIFATCYNSLGVAATIADKDVEISRPGSSASNRSFESLSETSDEVNSDAMHSVNLDMLAVDENQYVMAVVHRSLPFYGFQFHPESCRSNANCHHLLRNWFDLVKEHNKTTRNQARSAIQDDLQEAKIDHLDETQGFTHVDSDCRAGSRTTKQTRHQLYEILYKATRSSGRRVTYRQERTHLDRLAVSNVVQRMSVNTDMAMLESTRKGRFSIYALLDDSSPQVPNAACLDRKPSKLTLSVRNGKISVDGSPVYTDTFDADSRDTYAARDDSSTSLFKASVNKIDILGAIEDLMTSKQASGGCSDLPFWGGFVGFMSYEMGLDHLGICYDKSGIDTVDDMNLVWVERSLVYDSLNSTITVQSLREDDGLFIDSIFQLLRDSSDSLGCPNNEVHDARLERALEQAAFELPDQMEYNRNYDLCQENLRAGNSYELCLTTEARITLPVLDNDLVFRLYQNMHTHNPVPYGAFLDLKNITILSTSPEEFMSWDRRGTIDMRPMKGTVKRSPDMTLAKATQILSTPKESAENLMIADLIRHDLYSAVGYTSRVEVAKLCEVIEHETVYQLVSHIQATAPVPRFISDPVQHGMAMHYGFKALTTSLPPGSMTGAPKKRSCEILNRLEKRDRGLYSGVLGYLDVGGGGAWNVCIRTAFKVKDNGTARHTWRIGAGGAITVLSDRQGEWEEMQTKLNSVLKGFRSVRLTH